jgi:hypothetical protein
MWLIADTTLQISHELDILGKQKSENSSILYVCVFERRLTWKNKNTDQYFKNKEKAHL